MAKFASPSVSIRAPFVARTDAQVLLGLSPLDSADTHSKTLSPLSLPILSALECALTEKWGEGVNE